LNIFLCSVSDIENKKKLLLLFQNPIGKMSFDLRFKWRIIEPCGTKFHSFMKMFFFARLNNMKKELMVEGLQFQKDSRSRGKILSKVHTF
jgi:hypothetical protein